MGFILPYLSDSNIIYIHAVAVFKSFRKIITKERSVMKDKALPLLVLTIFLLFISGCGEGETLIFVSFNGSTDNASDKSPGLTFGFVSVSVTDAKPLLPSGIEEVWISFEEVLVHSEGGDWISLPLIQAPYTIDLLRYHSGNTTELIRPVSLQPGTYDRMRISIGNALVMSNGNFYPIVISPGNLTIEESFSFDLEKGSIDDLTVDFDLSLSLLARGSPVAPSYELTPVLHINHTEQAALIRGEIAPTSFGDSGSKEAIVTVYKDSDLSGSLTSADEEYTRIRLERENPQFRIFWLVPEEGYTVTVELNGREPSEFEEYVHPADMQRGGIFDLNDGTAI